jgi:hypothetical protein
MSSSAAASIVATFGSRCSSAAIASESRWRACAPESVEDRPDQGGQEAVLIAAGVAEAVSEEVDAAALPGAAKEARDRRLEPLVASETTSCTLVRQRASSDLRN